MEDLRQQEIADLKSRWAQEKEDQEKADYEQHQKNQALGEELRAFNIMKQNEAKKILEKERREDRRIVQVRTQAPSHLSLSCVFAERRSFPGNLR